MLKEGLGINLVENDYSSNMEDTSIEAVLTEEIEGCEYKSLGKGENAFVALPKPITETHHEESEYFPNADLENTKTFFLVAGFNKETKNVEEFLLVFEQLKTGNIVFTDPRPLEDWLEIVNGEGKDCEKCIYKSNKGHSMLSYGNWIVKDKEKYKVKDVGISNSNSMYLEKKYTPEEYKKIVELNQKAA